MMELVLVLALKRSKSWWKSQAWCVVKMSLTDLQNASHGSKKTCDLTVKPLCNIKWRGVKQNKTQNGCCTNGYRWKLRGNGEQYTEEWDGWWIEGEQPVSHSRPGLSAGGYARARSQACCHAEAFTGTQWQIGWCWHQVASLIHPSTA